MSDQFNDLSRAKLPGTACKHDLYIKFDVDWIYTYFLVENMDWDNILLEGLPLLTTCLSSVHVQYELTDSSNQ